jgi:radical SAM protein with 4Fe4S-binding SPASM domain
LVHSSLLKQIGNYFEQKKRTPTTKARKSENTKKDSFPFLSCFPHILFSGLVLCSDVKGFCTGAKAVVAYEFMETQSYQDWSLSVHEHVTARRVPVSGSIEVTRRCNLNCVHCYNNLPLNDEQSRRTELTYEEYCHLLDEMAAEECLWLLFTGGEIFIRKDFPDIYVYAKKAGFLITLFTNATLITPEIAEYLAAWSPFSIEVSLYGCTAGTHDRVTGVAGSFDRTLRGVRLLMEVGLPPILKTMVLKPNAHEIWDLKRFVEEGLGLEFRFDATINPRVDSSTAPLGLRLSPSEVVALDLMEPNRRNEWVRFCEHFNRPVHPSDKGVELYACGGSRNAFAIDAFGRLGTCVLWHGETYDLRNGTFKEGWEEFLLNVSRVKMRRDTKCLSCGLRSMCGMCPANGVLECGHAEEPVDFLCQVAHLRAYAFGIPISPHGDCEYCPGGKKHQQMMARAKTLTTRTED